MGLAVVGCALLVPSAGATPPPPPAPRSLAAPSTGALLRAFTYVRDALRSAAERETGGTDGGEVDAGLRELTGEGPPDIGASGVCVTLRLDADEVAREWSMTGVQDLKAAAARAASHAADSLPVARDALQRRARTDAWERVRVSIELAGTPVPLDLTTFADADGRVQVGLEGVGVRMGDRTEVVFPAQMLIANGTPGATLIGLVSRVSGDPTLAMPGVDDHEAGAIARSHAVTYFKFASSHAAQSLADGPPMILHRGGRVITSREVSLLSLKSFARNLSDNLLAQRTRVEGREELFTSYFPLQGRNGDLAGPREKSMVCLALCEGARISATPDPTNPLPKPVEAAQEMLIPMLSIDGRLPDADLTPASAAALVVAMSELFAWTGKPRGDWFDGRRDRLATTVRSATGEDGAWNDLSRPGERGLIALALVQLAVDPVMGEGVHPGPAAAAARDRARGALQALYRATPVAGLVSHMPWLGRAEALLAGDGPIAPAAALRQVREQAWGAQVSADAAASTWGDTEGGLALGGASADGSPTVHSARALAFIAQMLGDPRLTDDTERHAQISRLLSSLRFLRQLAVDESHDWCVPDPARAHWGVRASVCDQRQSVEGTAMTLMTVSAMVRGVEGTGTGAGTNHEGTKSTK